MLADTQLEALMRDLESDRVERKESLSNPGRIREAICAFSNDLPGNQEPGVVFIGVKDDGSCAELEITDSLLRQLADMRSDGNITPFPELIVQKKRLAGCEVAVVQVEPSRSPPVRYKGRVWIRVGPRRAVASRDEERRLSERRRSSDLPFDLQPVASASLADMDRDGFINDYLPASVSREVLEENRRGWIDQARSLRFLTADPEPMPTVVGLLVSGLQPRDHLPCSYIQFIRFDGEELDDPIKDQKEISGPILELTSKLEDVFEAHIQIAMDIEGATTDERRPDYPLVALQQLSRNAIMHRNYEGTHAPVRVHWFHDRMEVQSPGGPYGLVNRDNFGQPNITDYRNPHLAEAMKNLGLVQRFGVGIAKAKAALKRNGNPPLEFEVEDTHVGVTIRSAR